MKLRYALPLTGLIVWILAEEDDLVILPLSAIAWLGVLIALRFRPSLQTIWRDRRLPRKDEIAAVLIGQGGSIVSLLALGEAVGFITMLITGEWPSLEQVPSLAGIALVTLAVGLPLWRELAWPTHELLGRVELWPSGAGLLGGAPLTVGLIMVLGGMVDPMLESLRPWEMALEMSYFTPLAVLLLSIGAVIIGQAWRRRLDAAGAVRKVIFALMITWAVLASGLIAALSGVLNLSVATIHGGDISAAFAIPVCAAWVVALWRLREIEPRGPILTTVAACVLFFVSGFSMAIPALLLDTQWPAFTALLVFLPYLLIVPSVAIVLPLLLRMLARRRDTAGARPANITASA